MMSIPVELELLAEHLRAAGRESVSISIATFEGINGPRWEWTLNIGRVFLEVTKKECEELFIRSNAPAAPTSEIVTRISPNRVREYAQQWVSHLGF
ncbi:hypothetical protein MF271_06285 [Deinococcus sp. KNUC1210]|uniref:hypothetical protein n=1 Tax=Deinococcus sp. KNUC1210 TaxID=2917691 RepID=UPI001EEFB132|nr:hypothetical protein [Deinococcus sp. KNUC1210]ULH16218.1 hypothetical protein MF271_06285 [Deinococcus sp. KNUC1210]